MEFQLEYGYAGLKFDLEKEILPHNSSQPIVAMWMTLAHQAQGALLFQRSHQTDSDTAVRQARYLS